MSDQLVQPRYALNKAYRKVKISRADIEKFKGNLVALFDHINPNESEEFHKNLVADFLKNTFYGQKHFINTKGRNDQVIHNGANPSSTVGVIIEAKSPVNKSEMVRTDNLNAKAFQELVLYYLRERITQKNLEIKHLVLTNIHEWFVFDAHVFEKEFAQNKQLVKLFADFEEGRLAGTTTDFFYANVAKPAIEAVKHTIPFVYFDLRDYQKTVRNTDKTDDTKLIALYKLLSAEHLLKLPFANDSNSLDKAFYAELLHIIGLTEIKEGGKKLIQRKKEGERNPASLLESTIFQLDQLDKIHRLPTPSAFGANKQERLFNVGLELVITWINRVLFLKLLEAQLLKYHKGNKQYAFLNLQKVKDFDALNKLFFSVLAVKPNLRDERVQQAFAHVPYLNSSLFETTDLEQTCLFISQLEADTLSLWPATVIKDNQGKRRNGQLDTLEYLFEFLNAYDFSSDGGEEIQEENKSLINASVLGLIFEKINGYRDGSFFTPGFVTMYMCRETIRRAIVDKFNAVKNWNCTHFDQLYDKIDDKHEANAIINSLKICDPAVGSGHFLVSALNEIIAVKSELKILRDRQGKTLRDYTVEVLNDELIVTDDDGRLFEYNPHSPESQRVQETLFHEKQTIIENCLFGVDINPNSVKICRLRLWIELLKNTYYKTLNSPPFQGGVPAGGGGSGQEPPSPSDTTPYKGREQLETLPNIDINIKCGNSLISRYSLDANIKAALKRSKWSIDSYRLAVMSYRNAQSKDEKRELERLIRDIKNDFETEVAANDKRLINLNKAKGELLALTTQTSLFERSKAELNAWQKKVKEQQTTIDKLETEIQQIRHNQIFENAFEWRFEFPEVLNDDGDFVGFDVVIGNPPYIRQEEFSDIKNYLQANYQTFAGMADMYVYFVERGLQIAKANGHFIYILPNKWMRAGYGNTLRKWVEQFDIQFVHDFGDLPVFDEATTYPCLWSMTKRKPIDNKFKASNITTLDFPLGMEQYIANISFEVNQTLLKPDGWSLVNDKLQNLLEKLKSQGTPLGEYVKGKIYRGVLTGFNEAFVIDKPTKERLVNEDARSAEIIKPFLAGRDIKRYQQPQSDKFLIFTKRGIDIDQYPAVKQYLFAFKDRLEPKPKDYIGNEWGGRKPGNYKWYEIQDAVDYFSEFEKIKIVWPETSLDNQFTLLDEYSYLDKTSFFIPLEEPDLLGLLNSTLARFFLGAIVSKMRGGYFSLSKAYVETFPVTTDINCIHEIGKLVKQILTLKSQSPTADTAPLEAEIDQLVYQLYGLTADEIQLVEGS